MCIRDRVENLGSSDVRVFGAAERAVRPSWAGWEPWPPPAGFGGRPTDFCRRVRRPPTRQTRFLGGGSRGA
eukprot:8015609-Alexandrium_andersonii.AAC.1